MFLGYSAYNLLIMLLDLMEKIVTLNSKKKTNVKSINEKSRRLSQKGTFSMEVELFLFIV